MSSAWEISIPDRHNPGMFVGETIFSTRKEALDSAKKIWGADEEGRVSLINELPDGEEI